MSDMREFEGALLRPPGVGTWVYVDVPFDAAEAYGAKGQIRVRGTVNGAAFRSSLLPHGNGRHYLVVGGPLRCAAGAEVGDVVRVAIEPDTEERTIEVPPDLQEALEARPEALDFFAGLAYTYRKEYVDWIESAKREQTRASRVSQAVGRLAEGRKLRG